MMTRMQKNNGDHKNGERLYYIDSASPPYISAALTTLLSLHYIRGESMQALTACVTRCSRVSKNVTSALTAFLQIGNANTSSHEGSY